MKRRSFLALLSGSALAVVMAKAWVPDAAAEEAEIDDDLTAMVLAAWPRDTLTQEPYLRTLEKERERNAAAFEEAYRPYRLAKDDVYDRYRAGLIKREDIAKEINAIDLRRRMDGVYHWQF